MMDRDVEVLLRTYGGVAPLLFQEIDRMRELVVKGLAVVEDFMPNVGKCVLQDYAQLNTFMVDARAVGWRMEDIA
jgi:hypothetical protein